jgi:1,4-dihydroxy-2-naphthoyl-CoA hydrolase
MATIVHHIRIALGHTDAAGLLYFVNQLQYVHEAYEALLAEIGFPARQVVERESFLIPLVHLESDYQEILHIGDRIRVITAIERIGNTSFILSHQLVNSDDRVVGTARTVHVTMNRTSRQKISLPDNFRKALEEFQQRS